MEPLSPLSSRDKNDSLARLAAGIAQEFDNFLTAIRGYTQLSLDEFTQAEGGDRKPRTGHGAASDAVEAAGRESDSTRRMLVENLRGIERAGSTANELMNALLTFSGESSVRYTQVSIDRLLAAERSQLSRLAGPKTLVVWDVSPGTPDVMADRSQLLTLVTQLVRNAADAIG